MQITSLEFLAVVFIILLLYFLFQKSGLQKYIVIAANLYFMYRFSDIFGLIFALLLVLIVWVCAILINRELSDENGSKAKIRILFWTGALFDLAILCYFKFFHFTLDNIKEYLSLSKDLLAPVGLAYFSLSLLGYLIDVYHKKYPAEKNYIDLMSMALFFPAVIQGPFGFYKKLSPQLKENHSFDFDRMVSGLQRLLWGYFKKLVIADRIGIIVMGILRDDNSAGFLILYALMLYSFQIYADFSGGIDVIMGVSEIMGISLHENFKSPLISQSVTEYWQRWHMSLGEWMERYVYYPVVLSRRLAMFAKRFQNKNLKKIFSATVASVVVFIIVGIWHGTGWNYVVYGMYQAFFVSTAVLLKSTYTRINDKLKLKDDDLGVKVFRILRTFMLLTFGRYFIKAGNLGQAKLLFKKTISDFNPEIFFNGQLLEYGLDFRSYYLMIACIIVLIVVDILHERGVKFRACINGSHIVFRYAIYMFAIFMIVICGVYGPEYDATSFIYAGF